MAKSALITGITGQDGAYLAQFLLDKGYKVFGTYRRLSTPNFWRLQYLDIFAKLNLIPADLVDSSSIIEAIKIAEPDEVYHLVTQSFVDVSFEQPVGAGEITGLGVTRVLEAIRDINPRIRFYQASTSELYGRNNSPIQAEDTPFQPSSPYAAAKLYGYWVTRIYREGYHLFACNGILFNHESPLRGMEFVTRKISNTVAKIALGLEKILEMGNLVAKRDWGYAPEYVPTMWLMLQQPEPDDYVIATNESHSVREFVEKAFAVGKKVVWTTEADEPVLGDSHVFLADPTVKDFARGLAEALSAKVEGSLDLSDYTWERYFETVYAAALEAVNQD